MDYKVVKTGSAGNCVLIDHIAVDIGVPYSLIKEEEIQLLLLTHTHSDHIRPTTLKTLLKHHPLTLVCAPYHMRDYLREHGIDDGGIARITYLDPNTMYDVGTARLICEPVPHNVPNVAWKIKLADGTSIFYATDAGNLNRINAFGYDYYFIEANYGQDEIMDRIRHKEAAGEYVHEWDAMENHLSREQAIDWLAHNTTPESKVIYLHQHQEK